jgi:hypothetical protein
VQRAVAEIDVALYWGNADFSAKIKALELSRPRPAASLKENPFFVIFLSRGCLFQKSLPFSSINSMP